ncbi:MAG TPA: TetR/AcrR family transcriptional regulator [Sporichthyaceae bacterium]|jgi:AcrR family transcriptional regulator|nr:TetR/AcrR family transcriptional regulator [Sporichthyaceae bacterium]
MEPSPAPTTTVPRRVRLHRATTDEIKSLAREQLALEGAGAISLRAVARSMGMASSAVYRYFPSREHLITALCADAYDSLGEAMGLAVAAVGRRGHARRWWAMSHAMRAWSLDQPSEFGLIFGAPVPGHRADVTETGPASVRFMTPPLQIYADAVRDGAADPDRTAGLAEPQVGPMLRYFLDRTDPPCPPRLAGLALNQLASSLGVIALETFGALPTLIPDTAGYYAAHVRAGMVGLGFARGSVCRLT